VDYKFINFRWGVGFWGLLFEGAVICRYGNTLETLIRIRYLNLYFVYLYLYLYLIYRDIYRATDSYSYSYSYSYIYSYL
jgi:hypothetical protein